MWLLRGGVRGWLGKLGFIEFLIKGVGIGDGGWGDGFVDVDFVWIVMDIELRLFSCPNPIIYI